MSVDFPAPLGPRSPMVRPEREHVRPLRISLLSRTVLPILRVQLPVSFPDFGSQFLLYQHGISQDLRYS